LRPYAWPVLTQVAFGVVDRRGTRPVCPVVWRGGAVRRPPIPINGAYHVLTGHARSVTFLTPIVSTVTLSAGSNGGLSDLLPARRNPRHPAGERIWPRSGPIGSFRACQCWSVTSYLYLERTEFCRCAAT
jgi:hypothetical protein